MNLTAILLHLVDGTGQTYDSRSFAFRRTHDDSGLARPSSPAAPMAAQPSLSSSPRRSTAPAASILWNSPDLAADSESRWDIIDSRSAPLAQLDRASGYETRSGLRRKPNSPRFCWRKRSPSRPSQNRRLKVGAARARPSGQVDSAAPVGGRSGSAAIGSHCPCQPSASRRLGRSVLGSSGGLGDSRCQSVTRGPRQHLPGRARTAVRVGWRACRGGGGPGFSGRFGWQSRLAESAGRVGWQSFPPSL